MNLGARRKLKIIGSSTNLCKNWKRAIELSFEVSFQFFLKATELCWAVDALLVAGIGQRMSRLRSRAAGGGERQISGLPFTSFLPDFYRMEKLHCSRIEKERVVLSRKIKREMSS